MLPEISARRSLLEPSFRYLSPGREGEKCRPLDHMGQIPFIHSDRFLIWNNFYIYTIVFQLFLPCGTYKCSYMTIAHVLSQKTQIMIPSHFLSHFSRKVHARVHWNILLGESLFVLSFKESFKCPHERFNCRIGVLRGPFLESPETFRAYFWWTNSLCKRILFQNEGVWRHENLQLF